MEAALNECERAASQGHPDALCNLGCSCIGKDDTRALELLEQAAAHGNLRAVSVQATIYLRSGDPVRAEALFREATR